MDDSFSPWFLLGYLVLLLLSWVFARAERFLSLRSTPTVQSLLEGNGSWTARFLTDSTVKRRVAISLGIGALAACFGMVALASLVLVGPVCTADGGCLLRICAAIVLGLAPLVVVHFIVPSLKTKEEISGTYVRFAAPFFFAWALVTFPLTFALDKALTHLAHQPENREAREEALLALVENDEVGGVLEADKRDMISSIMNIDETLVREVMVPRVDMVAIDRSESLAELRKLFRETQHSRIPVYDAKLDNIIGIVHAKDLLETVSTASGSAGEAGTAEDAMRESQVLFVPATKRVDDLLRELRKEKKHMAIVVDEYGGTAGLVTMEDVLEEIVGEIQDEYDEEELPYRWVTPKILEVSAGMSIADLTQLLGTEFPAEQGYETIAGFLYQQFGAVPSAGESTRFGACIFTVTGVDAQRITQARIEINDDETRDAERENQDA